MKWKMALIFIFSYTLFLPNLSANALKPFETDYCTMFVEGPKDDPKLWGHCCLEHDLRYWFGGSSLDMDRSDLTLKNCVADVAGEKWASLIYYGVRTGHYSPIKNKYQWGWGWNNSREKMPLTNAESEYVQARLRNLTLNEISVEEFIRKNF